MKKLIPFPLPLMFLSTKSNKQKSIFYLFHPVELAILFSNNESNAALVMSNANLT